MCVVCHKTRSNQWRCSRGVVMFSSWSALRIGTSIYLVCVLRLVASCQQVFTIDVPQKLSLGAAPILVTRPDGTTYRKMQILKVAATFTVDAAHAAHSITFTIKNTSASGTPTLGPVTFTPGATSTSTSYCFPSTTLHPPCASATTDIVTIITPALTSPTADNRYQFVFNLLSNSNSSCVSTQTSVTDKFEIDATFNDSSVPTDPLTGFCLESFDTVVRPPGTNPPPACFATTGNAFSIPPGECTDTTSGKCVASVEGHPIAGCTTQRPGVHAVLVLDESGSMSTVDTPGGQSRLQSLQGAVTDLSTTWMGLPPPQTLPTVSDSIAAVPFHTAQESTVGPVDPTTPNTFASTVNGSLSAAGSTSIGAGLGTAAPLLTSPGNNRPVILLMSDGQQNTDPWVEIDPRPGRSNKVAIYCLSPTDPNPLCLSPTPGVRCTQGAPCDLPSQPPTQIYTVTIGPDYLGPINQAIAQAANGFYLNAETNGNLLKPYFQELLQNFLRFNSYETVRVISDKTPYSASIPLSTTSRNVEFSLMWPSNLGALRISITPPGGANPIVRESESGFISVFQGLPLGTPFDPMGNWKIDVTALKADRTGMNQNGVPFDFHAMTDDASIKTELSVVPTDYAAGDPIKLRARLTQFGLPILGIGRHPGDKIIVTPLKPGQSLGDVLSDSNASTTSTAPDVQPGFEAKLFNTLQLNPLVQKTDSSITLFDDGKPEHGDEIAGDGVYSAFYPSVLPGHYNFLFLVEATDPSTVRFSRQQLRTIYVRPVPDGANSTFQTRVVRHDRGGVLNISMTPRFKPGPGCSTDTHCGRMGPGFGPYLWLTAPGETPVRAKDSPNLDGTYTASMNFTGPPPSQVSLHFLRVFTVITDSIASADDLPVKLGPENEVVENILPETNRFAVFFDVGPNFPQGTLGNVFNTGVSLDAGLEYIVHPRFSWEGFFGYHHFPSSAGAALNVYQFSVNGKAYLRGGAFRPFVNGGIGGYKFSPGSTYFGGNVGGGVLYVLKPGLGLQLSYNFHMINAGPTTKFSDALFGVHWAF
jgi:VWA domain-containing protein